MSCTLVRPLVGTLVLTAVCVGLATAGTPRPPQVRDRCPVCGMFVEKYRQWTATVVFDDGSQVFFDGPKDMFKFLLAPATYGYEESTIADVYVTDYYSTKFIDARQAVYVGGSDVMGPMGPELVPFTTQEHADEFRADHGGGPIFAFDEVTTEAIPK